MFGRFSRSWSLVRASAAILNQDRSLLLFPLISSAVMLLVALCFVLPLFGIKALDGFSEVTSQPELYALGFLFYVAQYFVIFFFNSALVGCVMLRMDGRQASLGEGIAIARSKAGVIFAYAVVAATVGVVLRMIEERLGFLGKLVAGLLGLGWSVAAFLVVPVLVARDLGPVESLKESARMLKTTWGENIGGQIRIGAFFGVINIVIVLCCIGASLAAHEAGNDMLVALFVAAAVIAILIVAMVNAALSGIYSAALYRYAVFGDVGTGFDKHMLETAFLPKK